jgi:SAM-dependent methyltransferase
MSFYCEKRRTRRCISVSALGSLVVLFLFCLHFKRDKTTTPKPRQTLSRLAPAGDSKVGGASQDTTRSVEKPLGVVDDKSKCEMTFWQKRSKEEVVLKNSHYEKIFTDALGINLQFYENKKVLDIGCGPRGSLEFMHVASMRVCADPLAIEYGPLGASNHSMLYVQAGSERLPFPSKSFDAVTSINNFDHVESVSASMLEIHRVLKQGGSFGVIVELHHKPKVCEPQSIPGNWASAWEKIGFKTALQKRVEYHAKYNCKIRGTNAIFECPLFDESDETPRDSFLTLLLHKI